MSRPQYGDERTIYVTIHYKRHSDDLFFRSRQAAVAAIGKMKEDVEEVGAGFVTVEDEFGNTIDFRGTDFVRVTTNGPTEKGR